MGRLDNKVAIVTGASSGMGEAITKLFAKEGASVVAIARRKEKLQGVIDEVTANGGKATAGAGDVSKEEDVQNTVKTALEKYGKLDIVVNNAGIFDLAIPVGDVTDEMWDRVIDINVKGPMRFFRAAIPIFLKQGKGVFVTVGSVASLFGLKGGVAYTTSKHAVLGLARNTAATYAKKGIRSNVIGPGFIDTDMVASLSNCAKENVDLIYSDTGANPRTGKPEEIAAVALFLASDDASYVNGQIVAADGGWTSI